MAEDKKSFLLYTDLHHTVEHLPDDVAGQFFKHILRYVNDLHPETDNLLIKLAFEPVKRQLKRDLEKYEGIRAKKSAAGRASAAARGQHVSTPANTSAQPSTVSVNVTVTVNGNGTVTVNGIKGKAVTFTKNEHDCYKSCVVEFEKHLQPKTPKQLFQWLDTIEKLYRIDGVPLADIYRLVKAARCDDFWGRQFLALPKLRKTNKDGVKYIVVFNENFKQNGKQSYTKPADLVEGAARVAARLGEKG